MTTMTKETKYAWKMSLSVIGLAALLAFSLIYYPRWKTTNLYEQIQMGMPHEKVEELLGGVPQNGYQSNFEGDIWAKWKADSGYIMLSFERDSITGRLEVTDKHLYVD